MNHSVEIFASEAKKGVLVCKTAQELVGILQNFTARFLEQENEDSSHSAVPLCPGFRKEFVSQHYGNFCEHVITECDPSFLKDEQFKSALLKFLMQGPAELALIGTVSALTSVTHTDKLHIVVSILDEFVSQGKFADIYLSQCVGVAEKPLPISQQLITVISSLPDKLANRMKLALSGKFHPVAYYTLLGKQMIKALDTIHEMVSKSKNCSTLFLSNLIGKIANRGFAASLFDALLPHLKTWCYTSPLWSDICSKLIVNIPEMALESVTECLLKKITFYPFFCKILKDAILTNAFLKHLITHKFLLVRFYGQENVLQNIVGHLCGGTRRTLLLDVLRNLLNNWANSNTMKHISYEQHFYITEALILVTVQLEDVEIAEHKNDLIHQVLSGVQTHLDSPNVKLREVGMVVAECIMPCLTPEGKKLKFEMKDSEDVTKLRQLACSSKFVPDYEHENFLTREDVVVCEEIDKKFDNCVIKDDGNEIDTNEEDEDDLKPYEMSEEDNELIEGIHPPRYITQCVDGLLARDDPKLHIASLRVMKKVIKRDHLNLRHHCIQLVTILLHLHNKYSLPDYNELRFSTMVEITVAFPLRISEYLTKEFYAQNYTLTQRMDILDILVAAAANLSRPETTKKEEKSFVTKLTSEIPQPRQHWKTVVEERIEKNTRRFSKKSSVSAPKASVNRFATVAGYFFFPLLKGFDSPQNTFDLLGEDCMVLGSLACSLGNIMYCARGTHVTQNMARSLTEFVWVLRYHENAHIRQGLLFALAMVLVSTPGFFLLTELQNELVECRSWLEVVVNDDPSVPCRELAMRDLLLITDIFQQQLKNDSN